MKPSLKDHQDAMAALLASGSAIPTSASRQELTTRRPATVSESGLIKQLENTIRQLRESNKAFRAEKRDLLRQLDEVRGQLPPEQAGCRKEDTQDGGWIAWSGGPCPFGNDVRVEIMWRDRTTDIDYASCYDWSRPDGTDPRGDIVAYRTACT